MTEQKELTAEQFEAKVMRVAEMIRPQSEERITANTLFRAREIVTAVLND